MFSQHLIQILLTLNTPPILEKLGVIKKFRTQQGFRNLGTHLGPLPQILCGEPLGSQEENRGSLLVHMAERLALSRVFNHILPKERHFHLIGRHKVYLPRGDREVHVPRLSTLPYRRFPDHQPLPRPFPACPEGPRSVVVERPWASKQSNVSCAERSLRCWDRGLHLLYLPPLVFSNVIPSIAVLYFERTQFMVSLLVGHKDATVKASLQYLLRH
mmetsp:Transcript_49570/g.97629  ORF Transcript_49570/g.97629 Transcript_49570/m.97629 type:complete len:215 (-) Transcript_49570:1031-1675(-)